MKIWKYNTTIKYFENGTIKIKQTKYDKIVGNFQGNQYTLSSNNINTLTEEEKEYKRKCYYYKVQREIKEIVLNNNWTYFVTFTCNLTDEEYTHEKCKQRLTNFLNYQRKKNPNMIYLVVPEFHKKGRLHFHALFDNVNWNLKPAIDKNIGKVIKDVFNIEEHKKYGYTTVSLVTSIERISTYILKYVTKDMINMIGQKKYWHSRNIKKPIELWYSFPYDMSGDFKYKKKFANGTIIYYN